MSADGFRTDTGAVPTRQDKKPADRSCRAVLFVLMKSVREHAVGVKVSRSLLGVRYTGPNSESDREGAPPCSTLNLSATTKKPSPRR